GRVRLAADLGRDDAGPRLDARVRGEGLWLRRGNLRTKARLVEAHAIVGPKRPMHLRLGGHDLEVSGLLLARRTQPFAMRIRELATALDGRPERFVADASVLLADGTRGRVVARTTVGKRAADVTLTTLTLDRGQRHFALAEAARMHLSGMSTAPRLTALVAGARLEARMRFGRDLVTADASLALPDLARVGRLAELDLGGAAHVAAHVALAEQLTFDATVDGERLRGFAARIARLHAALHSVDLVGDARLDAERVGAGNVTLSHLGLHARGTRERLLVTLDGERPDPRGPTRLQLALDGRWRTDGLQVVDADLWLRSANLTLPTQAWRQVAPAHLVYRRGAGTLGGLRIRSDVGELAVDGRWGHGALDVTVLLRDGDLQELSRAAGRPELLPAARWSGRVHFAGTPSAPLVEANLEARAAKTVAWLGLGVNALSLSVFADSRHAILHADARGRDDTRVVVDVHGAPRSEGGRITALAATLDRVRFTVHGHTWLLREPCTVDVGARVAVDHCRLGTNGRGEIALAGSAPLSAAGGDALDLTLSTAHLDLRDLHAMLAPGHREPPKTDFEIHAHLAGTRKAPVADLQLSGRGSEIDEGGLPENVDYRISAHYGDRRVRGQASMRQVGMSLGIGARFDLPTTLEGEQPISLELEARPVPFYKIRQLLPTTLANLKGFFSLRVNATGTTRHPHVNAELHMPSWGLDDLRDNNTIVDLTYDGRELTVNSVTSFEAQGLLGSILRLHPPRNSGTVTMELRAPVDVVQLLQAPRDAVHALVHDAPIIASAEVRNVELRKVPMQIVGFDAPLTSGRVNAAVRVGGTLHHPTLHADVRALGLAKPGLVDQLDLDGSLQWVEGRVKLSGKAALRGAPLLTFRGEAALDGRQLFDGDGWCTGALLVDVDVPSYELARLRKLQPRLHAVDGTLQAHAQLRGTFAAPDLRIAIQGRDVGIAHARFVRIGGNARLHERRWHFEVGGVEVGGGEARVVGELPRDSGAPLRLSIDARALNVGFLGALWAEIGEVRGTLDAHVVVSGSRAAPRPLGWARLEGGQLGLRGDARRYRAALELVVDGDEARLTRLQLRGGGGTLDATGRAQLDGLMSTQLSLTARAHAFTVAYGSA
ncbi:MAG: hypothetical protein ACXVCV_10015, partial [Polyangia bacterium]